MRGAVVAEMVLLVASLGLSAPAFADDNKVSAEGTGFVAKVSVPSGGAVPEKAPVQVNSTPAVVWKALGPVCTRMETSSGCEFPVLCEPDKTPMQKYGEVRADGSIGEIRSWCPGESVPGGGTAPPTSADVISAFKKVELPEASLSIQPPGGETLVNLPTIFSTQATEFDTGVIRLLGHAVVLHIWPSDFTWNHGDGTPEVSSQWPGRPFQQGLPMDSYLTHTYVQTAAAVQPSVRVTWSASWTLNGVNQGKVAATVTKTSPATPLRVVEAVPQLTD